MLCNDAGAPAIWHIALTEYVLAASLHILGPARDGAIGVACIDPWMGGNGQSVVELLPSGA